MALFELHAIAQPPQLAGSLVVFAHNALLPPLPHSVGTAAAQLCPQAGGVPLQLAWPFTGAGQRAHVVPHELVEVEVSGTQVPLQL
jgi:hypothetical protein